MASAEVIGRLQRYSTSSKDDARSPTGERSTDESSSVTSTDDTVEERGDLRLVLEKSDFMVETSDLEEPSQEEVTSATVCRQKEEGMTFESPLLTNSMCATADGVTTGITRTVTDKLFGFKALKTMWQSTEDGANKTVQSERRLAPDSTEDDEELDASILSLAMNCLPSPETESSSPPRSPGPIDCLPTVDIVNEDQRENCSLDSTEQVMFAEIRHILNDLLERVTLAAGTDSLAEHEIEPKTLCESSKTDKCLCEDCQKTMYEWNRIFPGRVVEYSSPQRIQSYSCDKCKTKYSNAQALRNHFSGSHLFSSVPTKTAKPFNLMEFDFRTFFAYPSVDLCYSSSNESNPASSCEANSVHFDCDACGHRAPTKQDIVTHLTNCRGRETTTPDTGLNYFFSEQYLQCSDCKRLFPNRKSFSIHAAWHRKNFGDKVEFDVVNRGSSDAPQRQGASNAEFTSRVKKPPQPAKCRKCLKSFRRRDMRDLHEMGCEAVKPVENKKKSIESDTVVIDSADEASSVLAGDSPDSETQPRRKLCEGAKLIDSRRLIKCKNCDFSSPDSIRMKKHSQVHSRKSSKRHDYEMRACHYCEAQIFGRVQTLDEHVRFFHKDAINKYPARILSCKICRRAGFSSRGLKNHNNRFHRVSSITNGRSTVTATTDAILDAEKNKSPKKVGGYCNTCCISVKSLKNHNARYHGGSTGMNSPVKPSVWKLDKVRLNSLNAAMDEVVDQVSSTVEDDVIAQPLTRLLRRNGKKTVESATTLVSHIGQFSKTVHICERCDFSTNDEQNLLEHKMEHSARENSPDPEEEEEEEEPEKFKCSVCSFSCRHRGLFSIHMKIHKDEQKEVSDASSVADPRILECDYCQFSTFQINILNDHLKIHATQRLRRCPLCKFVCLTKKRLKSHLKRHRSLQPRRLLACTFCGFTTLHRGQFNVHMRAHVSSDEHVCSHCDFRTNKLSVLKFHTRKHLVSSGEKIYECSHCSYVTKRKRDLRIHAPLHLQLFDLEGTTEKVVKLKSTPTKRTVELKTTPIKKTVELKTTPIKKAVVLKTTPVKKAVEFKTTPVKKAVELKTTPIKKVVESKCSRPANESLESALSNIRSRFSYISSCGVTISIRTSNPPDVCPYPPPTASKRPAEDDDSDLNALFESRVKALRRCDTPPPLVDATESTDSFDYGNVPSEEETMSIQASIFHDEDSCDSTIKISAVTSLAAHDDSRSPPCEKIDEALVNSAKTQMKRSYIAPRRSNIVASDRIATIKQPRCSECNKGFSNHVELDLHRMEVHLEQENALDIVDNINVGVAAEEIVSQSDILHVIDDDDDNNDDSDVEYMATYELGKADDKSRTVSCKECDIHFLSEESFKFHMQWHASRDVVADKWKVVKEAADDDVVDFDDSDIELIES